MRMNCGKGSNPEGLLSEPFGFTKQPGGLPESSRRSERSEDLRLRKEKKPCTPEGCQKNGFAGRERLWESSDLTMGSTFYSLHHHVVFSTKERRPLLKPNWRPRLYKYLGGTIRGLGGVAEIIGGVEDHVHILMSLRTTDAPADMVREFKKASSKWVAERYDTAFAWQEGYGIFSVSWTHCKSVATYIEGQAEHHRKVPFAEELKRVLRKNGVSYDPKWLV